MGIGRIFKGIARAFKSKPLQAIGGAVVESFVPGLLPVISFTLNAVLSAEDRFGPKTGAEKLDYVLEQLITGSALIIDAIERATGRELVDEEVFKDGLRDLAVAIVKILNAFRLLPKE